MIGEQKTAMTKDDRDDLAAAAAAADRRNQPAHLVLVATLALAISIVALGICLLRLGGAHGVYALTKAELTTVRQAAADLERYQAESSDSQSLEIGTPIRTILSDLQTLATDAGVAVPVPNQRPENKPGNLTLAVFEYRDIRDESLEEILDWARRATRSIPGLRVHSINVQLTGSENTQWKVNLALARLERNQ